MTLQIVPVESERRILVGEELRLQFRLYLAESGQFLSDLPSLRVFVFEPGEGRQGHSWAHPVESGLYETVVPSPVGPCYLFFSCPEARIGYAQLPHLILDVTASETKVLTRVPPAGSDAGAAV